MMPMPGMNRTVGKVYVANVTLWTPSGEERWSGYVTEKKAQLNGRTITKYQQREAISHAIQQNGFIPSSGLWHQSLSRLEKERPDVEEDFITGESEDTSAVLKFLKVGEKYADGLFIQYPFVNSDCTDFERDEKRVPKARQIWQMALPVNDSYVHRLPEELDTFVNTLYGMSDARKQLPDYAYVSITPEGERRVLRSDWDWLPREGRRVLAGGDWRPADRVSDVGFRVFDGGEDSIRDVDARKG